MSRPILARLYGWLAVGAFVLVGTGAARAAEWICPIYPYANFGSYCAYYSKNCALNQYVSLDAACGLSWNFDCNNTGPCTDVDDGSVDVESGFVALIQKKTKRPAAAKAVRGGLKKRPDEDARPTLLNGAQEKKAQFARLEYAPKKYCDVKLFQIDTPKRTVMKTDLPARTFGVGTEVSNPKGRKHEVQIANADIRTIDADGHVCVVRVGGMDYQVVLHQDTKASR